MNHNYIQKGGRNDWNTPTISSKTLGNFYNYKPIFSGGCEAYVPHEDKIVVLSEDDDHYVERAVITLQDAKDLLDMYLELMFSVVVVIDHYKTESLVSYPTGAGDFKDAITNFKIGGIGIKSVSRLNGSPLIEMYIDDYVQTFDVSHTRDRHFALAILLNRL